MLSKKFEEKQDFYSRYAHSFPLQVASEIGIIGLIGLIYLIVRMIYLSKPGPLFQCALLVLLYSLVEINLNFTVVWVLFWIIMGMSMTPLTNQKKIIPRASIYITLFCMFMYYLSFIVGSIIQMTPVGVRGAVYIRPYDINTTLAYLDITHPSRRDSFLDTTLIPLFHGHETDILLKQLSTPKARLEALSSDPISPSVLSTVVKNRIDAGDESGALWYLQRQVRFASFATRLEDVPVGQFRAGGTSLQQLIDFVGKTDTLTEFYAKFYYYAGFQQLGNNPSQALRLWTVARDVAPEWGYFHIELVNLQYKLHYDDALLIATLDLCKQETLAKISCETLQPGDYEPGSQYGFIRAIPSLYGEK